MNLEKKINGENSIERSEYTISVYTENQIGLITRIATMFSRRKISLESLNTSPTEIESVYRFTIVLTETKEVVQKICKQIEKQVDVLKVYFNLNSEIIWQEMALYKVPTDVIAKEVQVERLLRQHGATTVVIRNDYTVFQAVGHREETDNLIRILEPFGLIEFVRSARIAIIKDSNGFHNKLMELNNSTQSIKPIENDYLNEREYIFSM